MVKVAVLGAGNAGFAFAGYLGSQGHQIRLFEVPQFAENLEEVKKQGGIEIVGPYEGFGQVEIVTTNVEEAIAEVELILVVVPAFAHKHIAELCAPHLKDGQIVVLNPGSTFGALEFSNICQNSGNNSEVIVAETTSNIFGCRKVGDNTVNIFAIKHKMPVAAIPQNKTNHVVGKLKELFEQFEAASSILETSLNNANAVVHPTPTVLNTGWIETTEGEFDFYWQGMSPSVCKVMEAVDEERIAIGAALGYKPISLLQSMHEYYGKIGETLHDFLSQSPVHGGPTIGNVGTPLNLNHRYIAEDIPYGLVPFSELGKALGVPTPFMDSIILIATQLTGVDYRSTGRNLKQMGIDGGTAEEIKHQLLR